MYERAVGTVREHKFPPGDHILSCIVTFMVELWANKLYMFIKVLVLLLAHENEHSNVIQMLRFSTAYEYYLSV